MISLQSCFYSVYELVAMRVRRGPVLETLSSGPLVFVFPGRYALFFSQYRPCLRYSICQRLLTTLNICLHDLIYLSFKVADVDKNDIPSG